MNDRELMELAAKAAGIEIERDGDAVFFYNEFKDVWCPLMDDGDAFRLAVKLGINLEVGDVGFGDVQAGKRDNWACEWLSADDPCAATRRAIVRAAAAMANTTA